MIRRVAGCGWATLAPLIVASLRQRPPALPAMIGWWKGRMARWLGGSVGVGPVSCCAFSGQRGCARGWCAWAWGPFGVFPGWEGAEGSWLCHPSFRDVPRTSGRCGSRGPSRRGLRGCGVSGAPGSPEPEAGISKISRALIEARGVFFPHVEKESAWWQSSPSCPSMCRGTGECQQKFNSFTCSRS